MTIEKKERMIQIVIYNELDQVCQVKFKSTCKQKKLEERKRKLAQRDLQFNEYANNNCNFRCL